MPPLGFSSKGFAQKLGPKKLEQNGGRIFASVVDMFGWSCCPVLPLETKGNAEATKVN